MADGDGTGGALRGRWIRREDWRTVPWRNGGGVTHELLVEGDPFDLRISVAEVASDGPFSAFPGVDRVIVPLSGGRMRLGFPDRTVVLAPGQPLAFPGEAPCDCALLDGPTFDFNAMTRRATRRAEVRVGPPPVALDDALWFALDDGVALGGRAVGRWELVDGRGLRLAVTGVAPGVWIRVAPAS